MDIKDTDRILCAVEAKQRRLKMKAIFGVVVLLFGCSNAKPNPAKRSSPTCSNLPKQLSGREFILTVTDSGSSVIDMQFNVDKDLQIVQAEYTVDGQGPFSVVSDYKGGKMYVSYPGGCYSSPLKDKSVLDPEELFKDLKLEVSGILGLKGTSVDLYSYSHDERNFTITFEGGERCIPVSFAEKGQDSASAGSFLDLKATADTEKLKIPKHCEEEISRRSIPAMAHVAHLKQAVRRGFAWIEVPLNSKKRGFPWIDDLFIPQKRGFPWIDL